VRKQNFQELVGETKSKGAYLKTKVSFCKDSSCLAVIKENYPKLFEGDIPSEKPHVIPNPASSQTQ
jgi:hypothetical protein